MRSSGSALAWIALAGVLLGHAVGWASLVLGIYRLDSTGISIQASFSFWIGAVVATGLEVAGAAGAILTLAAGELTTVRKVAAILAIVLTIVGIVGALLLVATGIFIVPIGTSVH